MQNMHSIILYAVYAETCIPHFTDSDAARRLGIRVTGIIMMIAANSLSSRDSIAHSPATPQP
jgi:hypothetical protein